ncbi:uncharacterized protein LOC129950636 [Eupeodes corollae]|uniref:uncharacterized protein LOC129950636 n=1 Tax=Eupeodes corollae TaxID=290404 RepID=UPI00249263EB|nr:uncharacterized protein LOC129950636 [Eupeodes corollae]
MESLSGTKGTTPGADKISFKMLKYLPVEVILRLVRLYNNIMKEGVYPHEWKKAHLIPIPKPNDNQNSLDSYRPISLLSVLSKLFEKIIGNRLKWTQEKHLNSGQHGFRPGRGTHTLLHMLDHAVHAELALRHHSVLLSMDLEKAFERVTTYGVINQLKNWGINKQLLQVISSFMSNRTIIVKINGHLSTATSIQNGIPQGSPISTVLYNAYVNPLLETLQSELVQTKTILTYADNIFVLASGKPDEVKNTLNSTVSKALEWCDESGAKMPINKMDALHVCRKHNCMNTDVNIGLTSISLLNKAKILGLACTKTWKWHSHEKIISQKLGKTNNLLKIICSKYKGPHINTAIDIAKTLIIGAIQHGFTVYSQWTKQNDQKVQVKINAVLRTALGALPSTPIEALLAEANISSFTNMKVIAQNKLFSKSIVNTKHALHDICKSGWFQVETSKNKCAIFSSIRNIKASKINIPEIHNYDDQTPPWLFPRYLINISLRESSKESTPNEVFRQKFAEIIETVNFGCVLYTDASCKDGVTGYCVYRLDSTNNKVLLQQLTIPDQNSYTGEVMAIVEAFKYALNLTVKTAICSDSLSAILAIKNNKNQVPIIQALRAHLCSECPRIHLIWSPGHVGIPGNEKADAGARQAIIMPLEYKIPPFANSIWIHSFKIIQEESENRWNQSKSFLRTHKPNLSPVTYNKDLKRYQAVQISRLRLGHTMFNKSHLFKKEDPPLCNFCRELLTVKHILQCCRITKEHFMGNVPSIKELLDPSVHPSTSKLFPLLAKHNIQI